MIFTNELKLEEISRGEYFRLKQKLNLKEREGETYNDGFAKIKKTLSYPSLRDLLYCFKETPRTRRVSIQTGPRLWKRTDVSEINETTIDNFLELLGEDNIIFLSFRNGIPDSSISNEMGFQPINGELVSTRICIPGENRNFYAWNGSDNWFSQIHGIYDFEK